MSVSKTLVSNDKKSGSSKAQFPSLDDTNQHKDTQCLNVKDDQQPCCSKSVAFQYIRTNSKENISSSGSSSTNVITPDEDESNDSIPSTVLAYSDTAVVLNTVEFERYSQQDEETERCRQNNDLDDKSESGSNESTQPPSDAVLLQPVSRKPPNVCLTEAHLAANANSNSGMLNLSPSESPLDNGSNSIENEGIEWDVNNNPVQW